MGNSVEKSMVVGVGANTDEFNKAMAAMKRNIGFAQKATVDWNQHLKALAELTKDQKLTSEQMAVVLARTAAQMEKNNGVVREAMTANSGWKASLDEVNASLDLQAEKVRRNAIEAEKAAAKIRQASAANLGVHGYAPAKTSGGRAVYASFDPATGMPIGNAEALAAAAARRQAAHAPFTAGMAGMQDMLRRQNDPFAQGLDRMLLQDARRAEQDAQKAQQAAAAAARRQAAHAPFTAGMAGMQDMLRRQNDPFAQGLDRMRLQNARRAEMDAENAARRAETDAKNAARRAERNALTQQGGAYMSQFQTAPTRASQLTEASHMYRSGAINADQYAQAVMRIREQHSMLGRSFGAVGSAITTMIGPLVVAYKAYETLVDSVKKAMDMQRNVAKISTFVGNRSDATAMLNEVRAFARDTPVSFDAAQRALTVLLQFGVATEKAVPSLKAIAEITGGDSMRMENLALAFAQTQAAGRLMGQELLQMVNAGFNPLKVISEQTGKSLVALREEMQRGLVSSEMIMKAYMDTVSEGGRHYGLFNEILDTTAGRVTQLASLFDEFKMMVGDFVLLLSNENVKVLIDLMKIVSGNHPVNDALTSGNHDDSTEAAGVWFKALMGDRESLTKIAWQMMQPHDQNMTFDMAVRDAMMKTHERALLDINGQDLDDDTRKRNLAEEHVRFGEKYGVSRLLGDDKKLYEEAKAYLGMMKEADAIAMRTLGVFEDAIARQQKAYLNYAYGDKAPLVDLLRESGDANTRPVIEELIDQGMFYEDIYAAASETAKQEADRLWLLMQQNEKLDEADKKRKKEEKYQQDTVKNLAERRQYLQDFIALGEREAKIRQDINTKMTRDQAEQKANQEMLESMVKDADRIKQGTGDVEKLARLMVMQQTGMITQAQFDSERAAMLSLSGSARSSISAPTAIQAGSAEAITLIANLQAQTVDEQQRLADRAFREQKITADATKKAAEILDQIKGELAPGMAP
jgi:tape measure domain-containing protein